MPAAPDAVGLVLSGGGARASFQIGALRYLYDEVGIAPTVITGTSAGSIIAAVLAQSADREGQRRSLEDLRRLFREMTSSSDMFEELPWFTRLRERGPVWMETLERRRSRQGALGRSFKRVADLRHGAVDAAAVTVPPTRLAPEGEDVPAEVPVETREEAGWIPGRLLESIETLRTVGRAGSDLEAILHGARQERSIFRPGRLVDRLLEPDIFRPEAVAESGVALRIAVVALESGELRYVTETGALVDRENRPLPDGSHADVVEAVRASCAIPTVFPPVRLGEENYVDGGVRESLPAEVAMTHLGVGTCYAVVAGPAGVAREPSFDDRDMFSIVMRTTTAIMTDEVQRDEVQWARAAGAVVIEPEFDVHDTLTIEPGLVSIAMDYGYLRAAEAHLGATDEERALVRDVILLRRRIWAAEEEAFGEDSGEEERLERVATITGLKFELRDLLRRLPAERLPEEAETWWRGWEHHATQIPVTPSWAPARD